MDKKVKLLSICKPKQYKTISKNELVEDGKYLVYGANGVIGKSNKYTHENPTLMVTCRGATCGSLNISKPFSYINGNAMAFDSIDKNFDLMYLYYYLSSRGFNDAISGTAQPQITRENLKNIDVLELSLKKQKQIAKTLDKAQELIDLRKDSIAKLDELAKSIFIDMFGDPVSNPKGWKKNKISDTYINKGDFVDGPFGSDLKVSDRTDDGIRIIQINNIGINEFRNSNKAYISEKKYLTLKRHEAIRGDIVIAKMGEPIARSCFLPNYLEKAIIVADCMRLRVSSVNFNPKFICFYLNFDSTKCLINNLTHGSTRVRINLSILKTLEILNPPIELQNKFAKTIEKIEEQKSLYEQELEKLEENFQALLQQSFSE